MSGLRHCVCRALLSLPLLSLPSCASVQSGASKLVVIQYDQMLNFNQYEFQDTASWLDSNGIVNEVQEIRINDYDAPGIWMLFDICQVSNKGSKADNFSLKRSSFFVEYAGKKHFAKELRDWEWVSVYYTSGTKVDGPQHPVANQFRSETQLGPDTDTIYAGDLDTTNRRFVIRVRTPFGDPSDLSKLRLTLKYDAGGVLLGDRGHNPRAGPDVVRKGDLPIVCRPPKH